MDTVVKLLDDFLATSRSSLDALVEDAKLNREIHERDWVFTVVRKGRRSEERFDGSHFFFRTSTEYSSPQLTLEEAQGIIAARLLEACGNYLLDREDGSLEQKDLLEISERLKRPPSGRIVPFILNADDTEPDRYSNNPFRDSIVESGQSAFPSATVKTSSLKIDQNFISKYENSLISRGEVDFIERHLYDTERYTDLVDFVKYDALERLSESLGIDLCLPNIRMPLEMLAKEKRGDPLHLIIQGSHRSYEAIEAIYSLMGRSMKNKTTLLTAPHTAKGLGSKRAAKGKIVFEGISLKRVDVRYRTTVLYPNMVDPDDLSLANADDFVSVEAKDLIDYDYLKTPSSPQFALYAVHSPEYASIAHGAGAYAGSAILKSYYCIFEAYISNRILEEAPRTGLKKAPLILNLAPTKMWLHPVHKNIDTSIGCIHNPLDLLGMGMAVEHLNFEQGAHSGPTEGGDESH